MEKLKIPLIETQLKREHPNGEFSLWDKITLKPLIRIVFNITWIERQLWRRTLGKKLKGYSENFIVHYDKLCQIFSVIFGVLCTLKTKDWRNSDSFPRKRVRESNKD